MWNFLDFWRFLLDLLRFLFEFVAIDSWLMNEKGALKPQLTSFFVFDIEWRLITRDRIWIAYFITVFYEKVLDLLANNQSLPLL